MHQKEVYSVQQQRNKLRQRREVCVLCFLFFPGEKWEHSLWASLGLGPRGLAFSFGTGVKPHHGCCPLAPCTCSPLAERSRAQLYAQVSGACWRMPKISYKLDDRKSEGAAKKGRMKKKKIYKLTWLKWVTLLKLKTSSRLRSQRSNEDGQSGEGKMATGVQNKTTVQVYETSQWIVCRYFIFSNITISRNLCWHWIGNCDI